MNNCGPCPRCGGEIHVSLSDGMPPQMRPVAVTCIACGTRIEMPFAPILAFWLGMFGSILVVITLLQAIFDDSVLQHARMLVLVITVPLGLFVGAGMGRRSVLRVLRQRKGFVR